MPNYHLTIRVDADRNILYMTQEGDADGDDLLRLRKEYLLALREVRPGFVLVHDQRRVKSFSDAAMEIGKDLIGITSAHGVRMVIRIAPEALSQRTRITRVLVSARSPYESVRVSTPEEAEELLEKVREQSNPA